MYTELILDARTSNLYALIFCQSVTGECDAVLCEPSRNRVVGSRTFSSNATLRPLGMQLTHVAPCRHGIIHGGVQGKAEIMDTWSGKSAGYIQHSG